MANQNRRTQFSDTEGPPTAAVSLQHLPDNVIVSTPLPVGSPSTTPAGTLPENPQLQAAAIAGATTRPVATVEAPVVTPVQRPRPMAMPAMDCATASLPAIQDLVQQVLDSKRLPNQSFFLVIVPDDASAKLERFERVAELRTRIMECLGKPLSIFAFLGARLAITPKPMRYLQTPFGSLPLFALPEPDTASDDTGWMGEEDPELEVPQTPQPEEPVAVPLPPAMVPFGSETQLFDEPEDSLGPADGP